MAETTRTRRFRRQWEWPNRARIAMSVGLALEDFKLQSQVRTEGAPGKINHFSLSYSDYGWKVGIWRILDLLDEFGLKGNMSTNGLAAERHPEVVRAVADAGHEVNGHGWVNDVLTDDEDPNAERTEIQRCTKTLTEAAGVRPVGWTSPGSTGSKNTYDILVAEGYTWSGDDASDDLPFLRQTSYGPLVTLPRTNLFHNDLALWIQGKNPPGVIWESFKDTFDELYAEGSDGYPKWTEITLHAHMAGRPTLIPTLRKCFAYAKQHDGVWFARRRDIADWSLKREGSPAAAKKTA
jgi:peptidoglycan/xylan/chitin deacetylase (PgdA/CDA1 family)